EKNDPKELDWYSRKTEKGNSDGWLTQDNPKEPAYAKEETPNIGIEVEKDNSNKQTSDRSCHEKESRAEKNMDYQRPADIELAVEESESDFYQELEDTEDKKKIINDGVYDNKNTIFDYDKTKIKKNGIEVEKDKCKALRHSPKCRLCIFDSDEEAPV
ncbi:10279_t:CDS:2, partial [Cetraspora pellucida]